MKLYTMILMMILTLTLFFFFSGLSLRLDIQTEAIHVFDSKKVLVISRCVSETASIKTVSLLEAREVSLINGRCGWFVDLSR